MNWLIDKLKWAVAGKELNQLHSLKKDLQMYRQWLAEIPELAFTFDHLAKMNGINTATFDDVQLMDIWKLQEHLRAVRRLSIVDIKNKHDTEKELLKMQAQQYRAALIGALEVLEWNSENYPDAGSAADDEKIAKIKAMLGITIPQPKTAAGHVMFKTDGMMIVSDPDGHVRVEMSALDDEGAA